MEKQIILDYSEYEDLKKNETYLLNIYKEENAKLKKALEKNAKITICEMTYPTHPKYKYLTNDEFEKIYGDLFINNYKIFGFKIKIKNHEK